MKEGDRVRVISGKYKGKTGIIFGTVQMGQENEMKPVLCVVQFDDGTEATLEVSEIEVIPWG